MIKKRPETLGPQRRSLALRVESAVVDKEARTVRLSFSSEEPIDMWYGTEVLSHAPGAVRMDRIRNTAPLLFNHNRDDLLGVIENVEIGADRRGYATARFGRDDRGEWAMNQVDDQVLANVSFMYRVYKFEEDLEAETLTATDWEPFEISLVTVPADHTVGVGREHGESSETGVEIVARQTPANAESLENVMKRNRHVLRDQATDGTAGAGAGGAAVSNGAAHPAAPAQPTAANERQRFLEIDAMCRAHNVPADTRQKMLAGGASIEEARGVVLDLQLQRSSSAAPAAAQSANGLAPDLSNTDKSRYSMVRAINACMSGNWKDAGFELEVSRQISKRMGKESSTGFFMPTNLPVRAEYTVGTAGAGTTGGTLVATNLLAGSFIEVLRNKARVMQLGATILSGLVGNVDIPRQTGATSTGWVGETTDLTEAEGTFDKVSLAMKHIGTYSMISRNMLMQSTPDIEMLVRADLVAQMALGIDLAALSGSGSAPVPRGIANQSGIGSVVGGTNGAALTIDHLISLETAVMAANAPEESLAYLANAKTVGALKSLKSTTGQYLWTTSPIGGRSGTPGEINGYPVARSNQARGTLTKGTQDGTGNKYVSELFFGAWSELLIGEWGVLEIIPNPYDTAAFKQGAVLIRAMQSLDIAVRHAASFAYMNDAIVQ